MLNLIGRSERRFCRETQGAKLPNGQWALSYIDKQLFNLTLNFSLLDWNRIRNKKYYEVIDKLPTTLEKNLYTLRCVKYYIRNIKQL